MNYGYGRISTGDGRQNTEKWIAPLKAAGVDESDMVFESISGKTPWRKRRLGSLVDRLQPGDVIVCPELSRLGRSTIDVLELAEELKRIEASARCLKEGLVIGHGAGTTDKLMLSIMAAVAEMERDRLVERINEGLDHARAQGKTLGRPKGTKPPTRTTDETKATKARRMRAAGNTVSAIARELGVSRQTIYTWTK